MINTKGPQRNLTIADRLFLIGGMTFCLIFFLVFFFFWGGIEVTFGALGVILIHIFFGERMKQWAIDKTKNADDFNLCSLGYASIAILALAISGIAAITRNNELSNQAWMVTVYALGILILNVMIMMTMQSLLGRDMKDLRKDVNNTPHKELQTSNLSKETHNFKGDPQPHHEQKTKPPYLTPQELEALRTSNDPEDVRDYFGIQTLMEALKEKQNNPPQK